MSRRPNVVAIVQARMGSTRLPGKAMVDLAGRPLVARVLERTARARTLDAVVLATTTAQQDDELAAYVSGDLHVDVFRGSEDDVLDRYRACARQAGADIVVRVTADDPFKDPALIDIAVKTVLDDPLTDYCSNTLTPTYPEGLDIEAFRAEALEIAWTEAALPSEREHVTPFIWKRPERFRIREFHYREDLSLWRWTIDEEVDLEFARAVYAHFVAEGRAEMSYEDVIQYLKGHPEIVAINAGMARNAGYVRSTLEDPR